MIVPKLPLPDPAFLAHFTNPIYILDLPENDEVPPFGTDEGSDLVHQWALNREELRARPFLNTVHEMDPESLLREAKEDEEVANFLISAAFTLLCWAGTIEEDDKSLVHAVLQQQRSRVGHPYDLMLRDLGSFQGNKTQSSPPPWLVLDGIASDPLHTKWLQDLAAAIVAESQWSEWWSLSPIPRLTLGPRPMGPRKGFVQIRETAEGLDVTASSPELSRCLDNLIQSGRMPTSPVGIHELSPEVTPLFLALLLSMFRSAADHLRLPGPPQSLPIVSVPVKRRGKH